MRWCRSRRRGPGSTPSSLASSRCTSWKSSSASAVRPSCHSAVMASACGVSLSGSSCLTPCSSVGTSRWRPSSMRAAASSSSRSHSSRSSGMRTRLLDPAGADALQRLAAPLLQRPFPGGHRELGPACRVPLGCKAAEADQVHLLRGDGQGVAGRRAGDALAERLTELGDLELDDGLGGLGRVLLPQGVDEPVHRHVRPVVGRQHPQHALLLRALDRNLGAALADLDRAEHADVHPGRA